MKEFLERILSAYQIILPAKAFNYYIPTNYNSNITKGYLKPFQLIYRTSQEYLSQHLNSISELLAQHYSGVFTDRDIKRVGIVMLMECTSKCNH